VAATGKDVLVRLGVLVLGVLTLATACGTAPAAKPDVRDVAEKSSADSSRIAISYGGREYFTGEWDFRKDIGAFSWGPSEKTDWDQIVTAEATYTRVGRFPGQSGATGKAWFKWEADNTKAHAFGGSLFGFVPSDPGQLLALLKAASSAHEVGKGEERGVAVRRYRAELDVPQAVGLLPSDQRELVWAMLRQYELGRDASIPLELALDGDNRLSRVDVDVPGGEGETLSLEFFDYGLDVKPEAPPADDVMSKDEAARFLSDSCPEEKEDKPQKTADGSSVCITVSVGENETGSGGLTSKGIKEGK
jgi:hypothetical protein